MEASQGEVKERVRGDGWVPRGTDARRTVCDRLSVCGVDFSVPLLGQESVFLVGEAPGEGTEDMEVLLGNLCSGRCREFRESLSLHLLVSSGFRSNNGYAMATYSGWHSLDSIIAPHLLTSLTSQVSAV